MSTIFVSAEGERQGSRDNYRTEGTVTVLPMNDDQLKITEQSRELWTELLCKYQAD